MQLRRLGRFVNGTTYISAISSEEASRAAQQITELLRDRHHLACASQSAPRPHDILLQFVTEAVALSLAGGSVGTLLGIGMAGFIGSLFGWPVLVRVDGAVVAIAISAAVGLLFGVYPAMSAARLDPIEALRFET